MAVERTSTSSSSRPVTEPRAPSFYPDKDVTNLYRRMISVKHPGLISAGLLQPVGPTIPLVEIQGRWLAAVLSGNTTLPDTAAQQREIVHRKRQRETYLDFGALRAQSRL
jgi:dimethylaniline monooxygenase (N-oxide forming)